MPSPQANLLTRRHRSELGQVATAITRNVATAASSANIADIDLWWDENAANFAALVSSGFAVTSTLSARYLRQHAALEGARVEPVQADAVAARIETALLVSGPVAFKKNITKTADPLLARRVMADQLRGTVTRTVLAGARDTATATATATDRIVGWRRVTAGQPCAFCAMVASRGAVYKERTALRDPAFHDHDRCTYEPLYRNEPEPADVVELRRQWDESTSGLSGTDALNAFRRHLTGRGLGTDQVAATGT